MKKSITLALLALAIIVVLAVKNENRDAPALAENDTVLPLLLDLGSHACVPCKQMMPILDTLKTECSDQFSTRFIDVGMYPEEAEKYGIRIIPTQLFFNAQGEELFRHEGFFSRDQILNKWADLGFSMGEK